MSSSSSSSAWEQWGSAKRPTPAVATVAASAATSASATASAAFQSLLRASPLAAAAVESPAAVASSAALKKLWTSARDATKSVVAVATAASPGSASSVSTTASACDLEALESGQREADECVEQQPEAAAASWPLFRRKSDADSASYLPTMTWNSRFKYFVAMSLMGLVFFGMASIFLPLIMIRPSKFALSFTFGSMCLMTAFAMLKGPAAYVAGLLEPKRLLLTIAYFLTLGATLYSCLVLGNYVLVVCSSVMQLLTLAVFAMSALPGGGASLKTFRVLFTKVARQLVQAVGRLFR